jgi:uncharacterized protein YjiK
MRSRAEMTRFTRCAWALALAAGLAAGCGGGGSKMVEPPPPPPPLPLVATHLLTIPEPSDVTIDHASGKLWMVGNHPERVYQMDRAGKLVKTLAYAGNDLEGVAYDARDGTLWVAEENEREVVHIDTTGIVLSVNPIGLTGELNSGLEGICLDDAGKVFVLNEKHPGLFIALKADLTIESERTLTFAGDYSGMSYNPQMGCFWIVSDQSERLYLWSQGTVLAEHTLGFPKPEGVAFDPVANLVYVVSDSTNTLYVFQNTHTSGLARSQVNR